MARGFREVGMTRLEQRIVDTDTTAAESAQDVGGVCAKSFCVP